MKLIDADALFEIVSSDKVDLNEHKGVFRAVHDGEYNHFLKRIAEQPEVHLSVSICYPNGQTVSNYDLK